MSFTLKWVFKNVNGEDSEYILTKPADTSTLPSYASRWVNEIDSATSDFSKTYSVSGHKFNFIRWSYSDRLISDISTTIYTAKYSEDFDTTKVYCDSNTKPSYIESGEYNIAKFCLHDTSILTKELYSPKYVYGTSNRNNLTYYNHKCDSSIDFFQRFYKPLDSTETQTPWIKTYTSSYKVNGDKISLLVKGTTPSPFYLKTNNKKIIMGQTPNGGSTYMLTSATAAPEGIFSLKQSIEVFRNTKGLFIDGINYSTYFENVLGYVPWALTVIICAKGGHGGTGIYYSKIATGESTQSFICGGGGGSGAYCAVILDFTGNNKSFFISTSNTAVTIYPKLAPNKKISLYHGENASGINAGAGGAYVGNSDLTEYGLCTILIAEGKAGGKGGYVYEHFDQIASPSVESTSGTAGNDSITQNNIVFLDQDCTVIGYKGGTSYYSAITTDTYEFAVSGGGGAGGLATGGTGGDCINIYDTTKGTGDSGFLNSGGGGGGCPQSTLDYSLESSSGGSGGAGGIIFLY